MPSSGNLVYHDARLLALKGRVTSSGAYTCMLVTTAYTANMDHDTIDDGTTSDPKGYEISVSGYARQTLADIAIFEDETNEFAALDATGPTFTSLVAGQTIGGAVYYLYSTNSTQNGTASTSDTGQSLLVYQDFTSGIPTNGGNIVITIAATSDGGLLKFGTTS